MGNEQTSEEYLKAVTIGERKPLDGTIELAEYNVEWPVLYAREEANIRWALGERALLVEHVGSTSVPGLPAKPIIDIILGIADSADEDAYVPDLERAGYMLRIREPDLDEHRLLKGTDPAVNLHVHSFGCAEIDKLVAFRDRLRADASDRELYLRTKRELAGRTWKYTQHYADAKAEVVREILGRAQ